MQEAYVVHAAKMQVKKWRGNFNVGFEHDLTSTERGIAGGKYVSEYKDDGMGWLLLKKMVIKTMKINLGVKRLTHQLLGAGSALTRYMKSTVIFISLSPMAWNSSVCLILCRMCPEIPLPFTCTFVTAHSQHQEL